MPQYKRKRLQGGYYFFTVVTHQRQNIFASEIARECLRSVWKYVSSTRPFQTVALCLMPDHIHCIWRLPDGDSNYSVRWSLIKRGFTIQWLKAGGAENRQTLSRTKEGRRGVWHRRFWEHVIRDEEDLAEHIRYIHYNPVKHKLVETPGDWKWSTYHRYNTCGIESVSDNPISDVFTGE